MNEIVAIAQGLAALKQAGEVLKIIATADGTLARTELKLKLAEVTERLVDAKEQMLAAKEEILSLREANTELKRNAQLNVDMAFRDEAYWTRVGGTDEGPYCSRCWEGEPKRQSRMVDRKNGFIICPACNHWIDSTNKPPPPVTGYEEIDY